MRTKLRSRILSGFSGGGSFFIVAMETASAGAMPSFPIPPLSSLDAVCEMAGAGAVVDMSDQACCYIEEWQHNWRIIKGPAAFQRLVLREFRDRGFRRLYPRYQHTGASPTAPPNWLYLFAISN